MAFIKVPDQYKTGLIQLIECEDAFVEQLMKAISAASATTNPDTLISNTCLQTDLDAKLVGQLVETLVSLSALRYRLNKQIDELVDELAIVVITTKGFENFSDKDIERLQIRLAQLLANSNLEAVAKAINILRDTERSFIRAKILTDLRPVFAEVTKAPVGALILHTLKVEYHSSSGDHDYFHLALDGDGLNELKGVIERALEKSKSLEVFLGETAVRHIGD